ncbi:hypothetical protein F5Y11DRAFT_325241 [Daldinia sp. FL1419]|nr:hypothetical protein F5Y11DRAFT_325241 [Daldinia sp. FL1419]
MTLPKEKRCSKRPLAPALYPSFFASQSLILAWTLMIHPTSCCCLGVFFYSILSYTGKEVRYTIVHCTPIRLLTVQDIVIHTIRTLLYTWWCARVTGRSAV